MWASTISLLSVVLLFILIIKIFSVAASWPVVIVTRGSGVKSYNLLVQNNTEEESGAEQAADDDTKVECQGHAVTDTTESVDTTVVYNDDNP